MADVEKVIKGLECCHKFGFHEDCPYDKKDPYEEQNTTCMMDLMTDALELLKEKEPVYVTWQQGKMFCGACGAKLLSRTMMRFCHRCGREIKLKVKNG